MKITFKYDESKDIWCLLNKGAGSNNEPSKKTKSYQALLDFCPDLKNIEKVQEFVRSYIHDNNIDTQKTLLVLQDKWNKISDKFETRAEKIFGVKIVDEIIAYLTITGRYPYSIPDKYFFVSAKNNNANLTIMHELWHFYTWHKFGQTTPNDADKYNDCKESLTALLNLECADLLEGATDDGYPQHAAMRAVVLAEWKRSKDINIVWDQLSKKL